MRLATYLVQSRHGIYYLRIVRNGKESRKSLGTRDPELAKSAAYQFGAGLSMHRFNKWSIKTPGGVEITTDGSEDDHRRALEALAAMQAAGALMPQPPTAHLQHALPAHQVTIAAAVAEFMKARGNQITAGTARTWGTSFNKLKAAYGRTPAHELTPAQATDLLNKQDLSISTIKKDAQTWRALYAWLIDHGYAITNPIKMPTFGRAQRVRLQQEHGRERLIYDNDDINKIFAATRLSNLVRPEYQFLPILGLYTGGRLEALCRLRCSDITPDTIRFDAGHDKTGKERIIPMHRGIIDSGLLTYRDEIAGEYGEDAYLFPHLVETAGRRSHRYSKEFGDQRLALGIESGKDFHSFRVSLISHMQANGAPADLRRLYVGHETGEQLDVHERNYSKAKFTPADLAEKLFKYITIQRPEWTYTPGAGLAQVKEIMRKQHRLALQKKRKARG